MILVTTSWIRWAASQASILPQVEERCEFYTKARVATPMLRAAIDFRDLMFTVWPADDPDIRLYDPALKDDASRILEAPADWLATESSTLQDRPAITARQAIRWVAAQLGSPIDPLASEAPSPDAYGLYQFARSSPDATSKFWSQLYTKTLDDSEDEAKIAARRDEAAQMRLIDAALSFLRSETEKASASD